MSAIVGTYYTDYQTVKAKIINNMLHTLAHRGPDGSEVWCSENIGFGHGMLWTTPESLNEKLPFVSPAGDLAITADARIDNRDELIPILKIDESDSDKITDSQIILVAYRKWGKNLPNKLLGDFAFAIWDRQKQELFCARDHFGVKPFYYYYHANLGLIFASEIKALFCHSKIPRQLDETRLGDFLTLMMEDKVRTTYQDILRLPPAHTLTVSKQGINIQSYWNLDPKREIKFSSDKEYAEAFRKIFTEAVRCRLRSAFPLGSHLSGGLDSSSVTCVARNILKEEGKKQLHTFSNIFDDVTECDERQYINKVLEQGDLISHYVHADRFQAFSGLKHFWQYEDEALTGPSYFYPWMLARSARQANVRIVFTGLDGDNVVCHGIPRLGELARKGNWQSFITETAKVSQHYEVSVKHLVKNYGLAHLKKGYKNKRLFFAFQDINRIHRAYGLSRRYLSIDYLLKPLLPNFIKKLWQFFRKNNTRHSTNNLVKQDFATKIDLEKRTKKMDCSLSAIDISVRKYHYLNLNSGIFAFVLEQLDRCHAAYGIESRHPFIDKRLVEFCLALPSEQKLNQGWGRAILRRALDKILPSDIQWREGKTSMESNFLHCTLKLDREILDLLPYKQLKHLSPYINVQYFEDKYKQITEGGKITSKDCMLLWRVAVLALWLDHTKIAAVSPDHDKD